VSRSRKNYISLVHRDLRTPKYKKRVVASKKKYTRKDKHPSKDKGE